MNVRKELIRALKQMEKFNFNKREMCMYALRGETDMAAVLTLRNMVSDIIEWELAEDENDDNDYKHDLSEMIEYIKDHYPRKADQIILPDEKKEILLQWIARQLPLCDMLQKYLSDKYKKAEALEEQMRSVIETSNDYIEVESKISSTLENYYDCTLDTLSALRRLSQILQTGTTTVENVAVERDPSTPVTVMDSISEYFAEKSKQEELIKPSLARKRKNRRQSSESTEKHFVTDDLYYIEDKNAVFMIRGRFEKVKLNRDYYKVVDGSKDRLLCAIQQYDLLKIIFLDACVGHVHDINEFKQYRVIFHWTLFRERKESVSFSTLEEAEEFVNTTVINAQ